MAQDAPVSLNFIDTLHLFQIVERTKEAHGKPISFVYAELLRVLSDARKQLRFRPADANFGVAAIDPMSDAQRRFLDALSRAGIVLEAVDYRHTYVTDPRSIGGERFERQISSLSPYLTYALGLLAGRKSPEIVIVSGAFDHYGPLMDFITKRGGKAAIAFFRKYLDSRWAQFGLFDPDSPIRWIDLEPHSQALLGVELGMKTVQEGLTTHGLASI